MWTRLLMMGLLAAPAAAETYRVVADESTFEVKVGRAGFLQMFGHDHRIRVGSFTGTVEWDAASPESARFVLTVPAASLEVADETLSDDDRKTVQSDMETQALALSDHPTVHFESTRVRARGATRLEVEGTLELRGVSHALQVPVSLAGSEERIVARGEFELESKKWGVPQISALGGTVKTDDKLELTFEIVAVRE